jgi:hypothetical protein
MYSSSATKATAAFEALLRDRPRRAEDRSTTAFHVLRTAAVNAIAIHDRRERCFHSFDANRVAVTAEHPRAALLSAGEHADDIPTAGGDLGQLDVGAEFLQLVCKELADGALAGGAGHEIGIDRVDGDEVAEEFKGWVHAGTI